MYIYMLNGLRLEVPSSVLTLHRFCHSQAFESLGIMVSFAGWLLATDVVTPTCAVCCPFRRSLSVTLYCLLHCTPALNCFLLSGLCFQQPNHARCAATHWPFDWNHWRIV
jgi:hypothetical protein